MADWFKEHSSEAGGEVTSAGTMGPRFDNSLDLRPNVYGDVTGTDSAEEVARAFMALGWSVRRSSWTEFEVEHTYVELQIVPTHPVNVSGVVEPSRIDDLIQAFSSTGYSVHLELYDQDKNL